MTNLVWPAGLPQRPMVGGYQERFSETVLRTAMDAGAAKTRRRFTSAPRQFELTFRVTALQADLLQTFFETTTAGGSLPFSWVNPRDGSAGEFRFMEVPRVSAVTATMFSAAVKLEQLI